jgi:toxin ParE1/3/4
MKVAIAEEAEFDLEAIGDYIARDNPQRAVSFIRELRVRCQSLSEYPRRFPVLQHRAESEIRKLIHGSYLILFRIQGDTVTVVRILHGATDYGTVLGFDS